MRFKKRPTKILPDFWVDGFELELEESFHTRCLFFFLLSIRDYLPIMLHLLKQYYLEDDPIIESQVNTLLVMLEGKLSKSALEGFLMVCSRLVDEFGNHRTEELSKVFQTHNSKGRLALHQSLEYMNKWVGGFKNFHKKYPVTIIPPKPAFPQFKIIGIENIAPHLYRVFDSKSKVYGTNELVKKHIQRTGRLPLVPRQSRPVRRSKPRHHWCSYEKWESPNITRTMLQILSEWSDCKLRATIRTSSIKRSAYVAFNGDKYDPTNNRLRFYKYYYEPLAQDHPELLGGGTQIALEGEPAVEILEQWNDFFKRWEIFWVNPKSKTILS